MDQSTHQLSTQKRQRLAELTANLVQAWQTATDVDLRRFLPDRDDPLYGLALRELVKADLQIRWQKKQGKPLESYVDRYPDLGALDQLPPDVLLEEYRARQACGQPPELNSYKERFPRQYAAFEQMAREQPTHTDMWETAAPDAKAGLPRAATPSEFLHAVGGYKLEKRIGQGSFAEVWQGVAPGGFPVAIKRILRPIDDEEAKREVESLQRMKEIRHPFLLQTHSSFFIDNHLFVVMELADGTLRDRMRECQKTGKRQIPLPELLRYFHESAEVLDYMHSQHMLHRDIKPQNILILRGHAKLADFGLALLQQSQRALLSATGCGTPAYMAPEVWRGKVGPQSDQYSLAFAYAEQRLGRLPFEQRDIASLMVAHLNEAPNLKELPAEEQQVLHRALAKEATERFATCQDFALALEEALRDQLRHSRPSLHMHVTEGRVQAPGSLSGTLAPDGRVVPRGGSATAPMGGAPPVAWKGDRRRPRLLLALMLAALLGGLGWFAAKELRSSVVLDAVAPPTVRAGEVKSLRAQIRRHRFDQPVRLSWHGLPTGWQAPDTTISGADNNTDVSLVVPPDAQPGPAQATLQATSETGTQEVRVELNIEPLAYALPAGWKKADGATLKVVDGRAYYDMIDVVRGDIPVRFLLIAKAQRDDPDTFYIMEDKVWVALFRAFVNGAKPETLDQKAQWKTLPDNAEPENPVMGVTLLDADHFVEWLGGKLPLPAQWDKAAGASEPEGRTGPFAPQYKQGEIAVNRQKNGPMKRGTATKDVSRYGCRDMAGNGSEWTGAMADEASRRFKRDSLDDLSFIPLRGWSYEKTTPLTFADMRNPLTMGARPPTSSSSTIGFRVVLEP
jgi:hypothetical protein